MNRRNFSGIASLAFGGLLATLSIAAAGAGSSNSSIFSDRANFGSGRRLGLRHDRFRIPAAYLARDEGVLSMNMDTKKITAVFLPGAGVHSALPVPGTQTVLVTNGDTDKITLFAADSGKLIGALPAGEMPDAAVFEPKSGLVAVMNHKGGTVTLVDPKKPSVAATVTVGGELEFAAAAGDGRLFVNVADKGEIAVIDVPRHKLVKSFKMKACSDPSGLAYDAGADLLISVCGNGVTKFLHALDGQAVGLDPEDRAGIRWVILDSERKVVFVSRWARGRAGRHLARGRQAGAAPNLETQKSARLGALDAKTGNVYLPWPSWALRSRRTPGQACFPVRLNFSWWPRDEGGLHVAGQEDHGCCCRGHFEAFQISDAPNVVRVRHEAKG